MDRRLQLLPLVFGSFICPSPLLPVYALCSGGTSAILVSNQPGQGFPCKRKGWAGRKEKQVLGPKHLLRLHMRRAQTDGTIRLSVRSLPFPISLGISPQVVF